MKPQRTAVRLRPRHQSMPFFEGPRPRVLAHRGLAVDCDENTLEAFGAALGVGSQIIETDVRWTDDGIAVLFHDDRLPTGSLLKDFSWAELSSVILPRGGRIPALTEALEGFPSAKFNIDIKAPDAVAATAKAIKAASAQNRVLIASFSETRRRRTVALVPGAATSATAPRVLLAVLAGKVRLVPFMRFVLRGVDAVQIPEKVLGMATTTPPLIRRFHAAGVEVHVWTINDEKDLIRLRAAGVDGVVTDRADLANRVFAL